MSIYVGAGQWMGLERGPGRVFDRIEIVVPSEKDRETVTQHIAKLSREVGAIGEEQFRAEMEADELRIVVRDMTGEVSSFYA